MTRSRQGERGGTGEGPARGHQRRHRGGRHAALVIGVCTAVGLGVVVGRLGAPTATSTIRPIDAASLSATDLSTTTTSAPTTSSTTTTTVVTNPTVQAPAGYASQLDSLYGEIYTAATAVPAGGQTQQVMTPQTFQQQVGTLSQSDLSMIYTATSSVPNFSSLSSTFQQADNVAVKAAGMLKLNGSAGSSTSGSSPAARIHGSSLHLAGMGARLVSPTAETNFQPSQPVALFPAASCPNGAPGMNYGETAIFALQVAVDVIAEAVAVIPNGLSTAFGNVTIPNIARIILAAIQLGVAITHDTFAYLQSVSNDCASIYLANLAGNTDNTAYQTFQQLTQVAGTANEIDTNLANLTNQGTSQFHQQLTLAIEQALAEPTSMPPLAQMELPTSSGGYLDSSPVGVNSVVTQTIQAMLAAGQPVNPQASRDETLAEDALGSGQYKLAFDYFRLAYQAAAG